MTSFRELHEAESVTADQLKAVLTDYAQGGWAIKGRVVIEIINRNHTALTLADDEALLKSAQAGVKRHEKMQEPREVREYQMVLDHLERRIASRRCILPW